MSEQDRWAPVPYAKNWIEGYASTNKPLDEDMAMMFLNSARHAIEQLLTEHARLTAENEAKDRQIALLKQMLTEPM